MLLNCNYKNTPEFISLVEESSSQQYALNSLSNVIIGRAIEVHTLLGLGLLESAYKECLYYELVEKGLMVEIEKGLPLIYKNVNLECGYRADLLVNNQIIIEIKSVESLNDIHVAQVLTYLKLSDFRLGLLINFNVLRLKDRIKRLVNKF
ncbi:MAG: GxxExxY protein [Bacteroidota bacterium]